MTKLLITFPGFVVLPVAVAVLAARWFLVPNQRKHTEWILVAALFVQPAGFLCLAAVTGISRLEPMKYDLYVYRIDQALGVSSFWPGLLAAHSKIWYDLANLSYGLLPVVMVVVFAANLQWNSEAEGIRVARTLTLNLFLAVPIYLLIPVCGPRFAFPSFPGWPGALTPHPIALSYAPNGIPSVHTSTAILTLWFLRKWRLGQVLGGVFLLLTIFATLATGQHYVFDLLCAVPYAGLLIWFQVPSAAVAPVSELVTASPQRLSS